MQATSWRSFSDPDHTRYNFHERNHVKRHSAPAPATHKSAIELKQTQLSPFKMGQPNSVSEFWVSSTTLRNDMDFTPNNVTSYGLGFVQRRNRVSPVYPNDSTRLCRFHRTLDVKRIQPIARS